MNNFSIPPSNQIDTISPPPTTPVNEDVINTLTSHIANQVLFKEPSKSTAKFGEVLILVGSSTAGKSSLISALKKQKPETNEYSIDTAWKTVPFNYLQKHHLADMQFLAKVISPSEEDKNNEYYLVGYIDPPNEKPNFKSDVSLAEKKHYQEVISRLNKSILEALPGNSTEEYEQSIISCMMDDIILESKQGKSIACDVLQVNEVALKKLKMQIPSAKIALVYVPFEVLAKRIEIRNTEALASGKLDNARLGIFPLEQFSRLVRPVNEHDTDSEIVQRLTLKEIKEAIQAVLKNCKSLVKNEEELASLIKQTDHLQSKILANFGFEEYDAPEKTVLLTPSYKGYHLLINTDLSDQAKPIAESVRVLVK